MYDLVCVGTTAIDMYFKGGNLTQDEQDFHLEIGRKYFVDFFHESVGGGATNVAIGGAKLGLRTALVSEIGQNAFKRVIFEKLDLHGVSYKYSLLSHDYRNFSTILLSSQAEKTVINYRTQDTPFLKVLPDDELFKKATSLYLGNLSHVSEWYRANLLRKAKRYQLTTFVTLGKEDLKKDHDHIDDIINHTDVLIINTHEFADYVRKPVTEINFKENVLLKYAYLKLAPLLILTDGEKGSHAYTQEGQHYQPAIKVDHVTDLTGAGDGFCAGFISSYIKHHSIPAALKKGADYAAEKLQHLGAN